LKSQTCNVCGKEKALRAFSRRYGKYGGSQRRLDCKKCQRRAQEKQEREFRAYVLKCRAIGDGYDRPGDGRILPDGARLIFELVSSNARWAQSMNQVLKRPFAMRRKIDAIEWLLGFDVVDFDIVDGLPRWTYGACRMILKDFGLDGPNDEQIKRKIVEWAAEIGMEVEWNAQSIGKGVRYGDGVEGYCDTGSGGGSSAITQFASGW